MSRLDALALGAVILTWVVMIGAALYTQRLARANRKLQETNNRLVELIQVLTDSSPFAPE